MAASIDLSFSYDGEEKLFSSFSLDIQDGEHVLLLSDPGTGKSTLSRILSGTAVKYDYGKLEGRIEINGTDILALDVPERMEYVSRVSQDTDEMLLFPTVEEELDFPLQNLGLSSSERKDRITRALEAWGLSTFRRTATSEMSGGEKRRLELSLLSALRPALAVLDEAYDELSPYWRARLSESVKAYPGMLLALGSHWLSDYEGTFDRVIGIDGRPWAREEFTPPTVSFQDGSHELSVKGLVVERRKRSVREETPFSLSVPAFTLRQGECVTLLGENGSGKSSLARVLSGLLKEASGEVLLDGRSLDMKTRKRTVAYLMQDPRSELFLPRVEDELGSTGAGKDRIGELLEMFSLGAQEYVSEMSYGRAKLVQAALFYLLDRPFAVLDEFDNALGRRDVWKAVKAYLEKGSGLLVITHDRSFSSELPGRKLEIREGRLCEY